MNYVISIFRGAEHIGASLKLCKHRHHGIDCRWCVSGSKRRDTRGIAALMPPDRLRDTAVRTRNGRHTVTTHPMPTFLSLANSTCDKRAVIITGPLGALSARALIRYKYMLTTNFHFTRVRIVEAFNAKLPLRWLVKGTKPGDVRHLLVIGNFTSSHERLLTDISEFIHEANAKYIKKGVGITIVIDDTIAKLQVKLNCEMTYNKTESDVLETRPRRNWPSINGNVVSISSGSTVESGALTHAIVSASNSKVHRLSLERLLRMLSDICDSNVVMQTSSYIDISSHLFIINDPN